MATILEKTADNYGIEIDYINDHGREFNTYIDFKPQVQERINGGYETPNWETNVIEPGEDGYDYEKAEEEALEEFNNEY